MKHWRLVSLRIGLVLCGVLICAFAFFAAIRPGMAKPASNLIVDSAADNTLPWNGCTLREAILSANQDYAGTSGCGDGEGEDTIEFWSSITTPIVLLSDLPAILDDTNIEGQHLVGSSPVSQTIDGNGHAIFVVSGEHQLYLHALVLTNASGNGAVYSHAGVVTLEDCELSHNSSQFCGALSKGNGALNISDSKFIQNTSAGTGGAFCTSNTSVDIRRTLFDHNASNNSNGGAINHSTGPLSIDECIFTGNTAGYGGGLASANAPVTITHSTFSGNQASTNGGALYFNDTSQASQVKIIASTFDNNLAGERGGGIYNGSGLTAVSSTLFITNTTVFSNSAGQYGAGLYHSSYGYMTVTHTTVANNGPSNGISFYRDLAFNNSIIANNYPINCSGLVSIVENGHNMQFGYLLGVEDHNCGATIPFADPRLGPLGNYGGATETMMLLYGSQARDQIPSAGGCGVGVSSDQRGEARPAGSACDIGAYEGEVSGVMLPMIKR